MQSDPFMCIFLTTKDARGEVFRALEVIEYCASAGSLLQGESMKNVSHGIDTWTALVPLGVCAGIAPFNFPVLIPLMMFPLAITCGNTFVFKVSLYQFYRFIHYITLTKAIRAGRRIDDQTGSVARADVSSERSRQRSSRGSDDCRKTLHPSRDKSDVFHWFDSGRKRSLSSGIKS